MVAMHDIKKLGARFRIVIISDIDFYASSYIAYAYPEKEYEKVDRNLPISLFVRNN